MLELKTVSLAKTRRLESYLESIAIYAIHYYFHTDDFTKKKCTYLEEVNGMIPSKGQDRIHDSAVGGHLDHHKLPG